jgi:hypothetical protein
VRRAGSLIAPVGSLRRVVETLLDGACFMLVSSYLACALAFLLATRRIDGKVPLRRLIRGALKRRFIRKARGRLKEIVPDDGHGYKVAIDPTLVSDEEGFSCVVVYEDGKPLPRPHTPHDQIRAEGGGAFSHWGGFLHFSTPDNSDPRSNGRIYTFAEV